MTGTSIVCATIARSSRSRIELREHERAAHVVANQSFPHTLDPFAAVTAAKKKGGKVMKLRWGRRSTGGVVKAGQGGWQLLLGCPLILMYIDPDTGHGASAAGWRLLRMRRRVLVLRERRKEGEHPVAFGGDALPRS